MEMNKQQPLRMHPFLHRLFGFNVCFFFCLVICDQAIPSCQVTWLGRVTRKSLVLLTGIQDGLQERERKDAEAILMLIHSCINEMS